MNLSIVIVVWFSIFQNFDFVALQHQVAEASKFWIFKTFARNRIFEYWGLKEKPFSWLKTIKSYWLSLIKKGIEKDLSHFFISFSNFFHFYSSIMRMFCCPWLQILVKRRRRKPIGCLFKHEFNTISIALIVQVGRLNSQIVCLCTKESGWSRHASTGFHANGK